MGFQEDILLLSREGTRSLRHKVVEGGEGPIILALLVDALVVGLLHLILELLQFLVHPISHQAYTVLLVGQVLMPEPAELVMITVMQLVVVVVQVDKDLQHFLALLQLQFQRVVLEEMELRCQSQALQSCMRQEGEGVVILILDLLGEQAVVQTSMESGPYQEDLEAPQKVQGEQLCQIQAQVGVDLDGQPA